MSATEQASLNQDLSIFLKFPALLFKKWDLERKNKAQGKYKTEEVIKYKTVSEWFFQQKDYDFSLTDEPVV